MSAHLPCRLPLGPSRAARIGSRMNAGPTWMVVPRRSRAKWAVPAIFMMVALALIAAGLLANANRPDDLTRVRQMARSPGPQQTAVAPLNLVKPLSPEEAVK